MIPVMGIDPGTSESAVVVWDGKVIKHASKSPNDNVLCFVMHNAARCNVAIEMVSSYGMPVGRTVFETVLWIGRFIQAAQPHPADLIYRIDVKNYFCHSSRAKDANVRQALIDRYGEPGTKKNPGPLYGLSGDLWQAFAVAAYWWDTHLMEGI